LRPVFARLPAAGRPRNGAKGTLLDFKSAAIAVKPLGLSKTFTPSPVLRCPFSVPAASPKRFLPSAAAFRSGHGRRSLPATASSLHARHLGAPFRARDEKSLRALCALLPGTG